MLLGLAAAQILLPHRNFCTDAIKKIVLESEEGKFAKYGAIQNAKLRREVTTISRMLHKNIVRYYQAWVEGDVGEAEEEEQVEEKSEDVIDESNIDLDVDASSEEDSGSGWWTSSPQELNLPDLMEKRVTGDDQEASEREISEETLDDGSWAEESDDELKEMDDLFAARKRRDLHSASMEDLLKHEQDQDFAVSSDTVS